MSKENRFYAVLCNLFVGAPVEGESGYINLMRLKTCYFEQVMMPRLKKEIEDALKPFPLFREELFDKLYTFFRRYFTESGSIGFFFTPYHQSVYERVYTDDQDVVLFWKTARLYYVKTDRLFRSMTVEVDGFRCFFDVSTLEHKKANEKRSLIFKFKERRGDGVFVFSVAYPERGRQTNLSDIRSAIKEALGLKNYTSEVPSEETLERAFRLFERQSEVDYFLCKDAKSFLREQFDLWLWQYLLGRPGEEPQTEWTEERLKQLQALKRIAYRVIDFIAAFEDELVRIWNKPKFVLNSHYVITLDRIYAQEGGVSVLEELLKHPDMEAQLQEWRELGMVDKSFCPHHIWQENLLEGRHLNPRYQHLPLDTRYFKDLELRILSLFDHLDEALDGWLIKSENYQALNTMLPKFRERVKCIYSDPPFNLGENADYEYVVNYKDAVWLTLLENRFSLARSCLTTDGAFFCRVGHDGNMLVRLLLNHIFRPENYRNEIIVRRAEEEKGELVKQFKTMRSMMVNYDNLYWYSVNPETRYPHIRKPAEKKGHWHSFWKAEDRPNLRYELLGISIERGQWMWAKDRALQAVENYQRYLKEKKPGETLEAYWRRHGCNLEFVKKEGKTIKYWIPPRDSVVADNNWLDIRGYSNQWGFKTENSEILLARILTNLTQPGEIVMDFFLGSGTTVCAAHKLGRKWIGIEVGEHFRTIVLPRMKKVLSGEQSGISEQVNWQGGGFFKYYELEQYEDTLRRTRYLDDGLFTPPETEDPCQYLFLRDPKMLEALEVNLEQNTVKVDLSKLYPDIDLAETLSNLTGKWIKRIHPDPEDPTKPGKVEFADGTTADLKNPDWRLIKPLIWW